MVTIADKYDGSRENGPASSWMEHRTEINGIAVNARFSKRAVDEIFLPMLDCFRQMRQEKGRRILVMLAAPPGAGKSTLLSFLQAISGGAVQAIGMDGFHRRQEDLQQHFTQRDGKRVSLVEIKGAPITFDLDKLTGSIRRVAAGENCGWPVYDRLLHNPVEDAVTVDGEIVLLEGNYLLLDADGWRELRRYADCTVQIGADENMLRSRLIDRRMKTGVEEAAAIRFVDFSDMPNVRLCLRSSMPADLQLWMDGDGDYRMVKAPSLFHAD